jgi:SAM-dependent methyltransferase
MLEFDAEAARQVEAAYLTGDVVQQRREVLRLLALTAGEAVLDLGSGPGLLATDMAAAVGPTGQVCGIDISDSMLTLPGGARFVAGHDEWTATNVDSWVEDLRTLGPDYFFSLNRYVFCATKPQ